MHTDYYVYIHIRPDTGKVFYVGKGRGKRCREIFYRRNEHYLRIANKLKSIGLKVIVEIVYFNLTNEKSKELEIDLINHYGIENLANYCIGGDGTRGYTKTREQKEKISNNTKKQWESGGRIKEATSKKVMCLNDGRIFASATDAANEYGLNPNTVSSQCRGRQAHAGGFFFTYEICNPPPIPTNICFGKRRILCVETGQIFESAEEAARAFGISSSNIIKCARGKRKRPRTLNFRYA